MNEKALEMLEALLAKVEGSDKDYEGGVEVTLNAEALAVMADHKATLALLEKEVRALEIEEIALNERKEILVARMKANHKVWGKKMRAAQEALDVPSFKINDDGTKAVFPKVKDDSTPEQPAWAREMAEKMDGNVIVLPDRSGNKH